MTKLSNSLIVWLDEQVEGAGLLVGGKFSSLVELSNAGFGVPAAFAFTTKSYELFMQETGIDDLARETLHSLNRDDLIVVEAASETMRNAIESEPLPEILSDAIASAYERLCEQVSVVDVPVAVRSSGVAEDLAGASFAGQYDTYLWVIGLDQVVEHVRRCWAGLFGAAALTYHPDADAPYSETGMAVVVQQMVEARSAGVMFTLDPVTGDRSKIVIESTWGLGEAVVSGEVTPDRFRIDKVTLEIIERAIATKHQEIRFEIGSGVQMRPVAEELQTESSLEDDTLGELASLGKRIERHRGMPMDIEWAVDAHGRVHLLQGRPETVWSQKPVETLAVGNTSAISYVLGTFGAGGSSASSGTSA